MLLPSKLFSYNESVLSQLPLILRELHQPKTPNAFDREGNYDKAAQSNISENTVLKLDSDEQALFGWKWSRKDVEK